MLNRLTFLNIRVRVDSETTVCPDQPETPEPELHRRVVEEVQAFKGGMPRPEGTVRSVVVEEVTAEYHYLDGAGPA